MATERIPMYCVDCGQATYDAKYCDNCRCLFCQNSPKNCACPRCINQTIDIEHPDMYVYCGYSLLPGRQVCYDHFCPVCLTEKKISDCFDRHCWSCYKYRYFIDATACRVCGQLNQYLTPNFNCINCECMYCDNIHCIVHKCLLCDQRISFNDTNMTYCDDHACKRCVYAPATIGRFCAKCSVNRTVGTHTKRAN